MISKNIVLLMLSMTTVSLTCPSNGIPKTKKKGLTKREKTQEKIEEMMYRAAQEKKVRDEAATKIKTITQEAERKLQDLREAKETQATQRMNAAREEAQTRVRKALTALDTRIKEEIKRTEEENRSRSSIYQN